MPIRFLAVVTVALAIGFCAARADESPKIEGTVAPNAAEATFVKAMQADLGRRFATAAAAQAAGYFRYTNQDETGAISYANLQWSSSDVHHPSQLWFDKAGTLLGADYRLGEAESKRGICQ